VSVFLLARGVKVIVAGGTDPAEMGGENV